MAIQENIEVIEETDEQKLKRLRGEYRVLNAHYQKSWRTDGQKARDDLNEARKVLDDALEAFSRAYVAVEQTNATTSRLLIERNALHDEITALETTIFEKNR